MKIVDRTTKMTTFESLSVGNVFRRRGILYMKTLLIFDADNNNLANAVDLKDGDWACFDCKDEVEVINAELTVKESEYMPESE